MLSNTTPSRVDISGSTDDPAVIIHRIPLIFYAKDLLRNFWFWSMGGLLSIFFGLTFGGMFIRIYLNLPDVPVWIGIPMVLLLLHALLLLRFVLTHRPIRIRIHAGTFYFDSWNGKQYKGKVSKTPLGLSFSTSSLVPAGWVTLDIKQGRPLARYAYRLKLDDALKLIAFGKAHNLDVTVGAEVSPRTMSKLLTNFINGLQKSKRN